MGRKKRTLSFLPASARIMTRLKRRFARSSGDIWEISGARSTELDADCSVLPAPGRFPVARNATTVTSAPSAAPAIAHGKPARHPLAPPAVATAAPHLWQKRAPWESLAPQA